VDAVVAEWEPGGAVAGKFRAYEHRPQQLELLRAVANTFNTGGQLVAEAGTGTGKGLAYLIPALHFAAQNSERVVVSTNTIALQDQLYDKDIPDLRRLLPVDFKAALLKGRTNYLCLWRYRTERERPDLTLDELTTLVKVLVWMPTTATGDWAELNLTPPEKAIWPRLTTTQETCLGHQCTFYQNNTCFLYRARKEANGAHVVVVNHALLLADLVAESNVLPDYRYLVVDEAHRLEEEATEQLGYRVSRRQIEQLLDQLARSSGGRGSLGDLRNRLRPRTAASARGDLDGEARKLEQHVDASRQAIASFFSGIAQFLSAHSSGEGDYGRRLRLRPAERAQPDWTQRVEIEWERASSRLADVMASLERLHVFFTGLGESKVASIDQLLLQLLAVHKQLQMARNCLDAAISQPDPNMVYWITAIGGHGEPDLAIHAAPLSVSELLRRQLFESKRATVLTSATISVDGSFDYLGGRLGLGGARELRVDSPFDYQKAALVYVPADVPEPNRPGHQRAVEVALVNLCRATQGRALVLFTSRSQLHATYEAIRRPLEQAGVVVLGQGVDRASRRQLLQSFRDSGRAVLLGLASFWEGVDVVGDALSVLVIVKLPFPVPSEPVFAARSEAFANAFNEYSVPQTVLKFKQGFGRLIRSHQDRGLLVVLDTRILTKAYGKVFLGSLPPTEIQRGTVRDLPTVAAGWLNANARQPRVPSPARPRQ
ncbi:MAG: DEAD/DEAH box helicase family protein, partial [Chloroflexi bacterium]|nr:DEAD/DEAH box helicase family protein [Chloroflexota bacterium]